MSDLLGRLDAAIDGRCPCGAEPAGGSAYCSDDCRPTHIAADTDQRMAGDLATAMRWRPDLVNADDDDALTLTLLDVPTHYTGPYNAQVQHRLGEQGWRLRLDNGYRYVEARLDTAHSDGELPSAMASTWQRLERELTNRRHLEPADSPGDGVHVAWNPSPLARLAGIPVIQGPSLDHVEVRSFDGTARVFAPSPEITLSPEHVEAIRWVHDEVARRVDEAMRYFSDAFRPVFQRVAELCDGVVPNPDQQPERHPMLDAIDRRRAQANHGPDRPQRPPRHLGARGRPG